MVMKFLYNFLRDHRTAGGGKIHTETVKILHIYYTVHVKESIVLKFSKYIGINTWYDGA